MQLHVLSLSFHILMKRLYLSISGEPFIYVQYPIHVSVDLRNLTVLTFLTIYLLIGKDGVKSRTPSSVFHAT